MVDTVKRDREVSIRYMKIFEQEQKIREEDDLDAIRTLAAEIAAEDSGRAAE